jgi:hypothetical protein
VWWINFTIAGKRVQESSKSTRKTLATEYEKRRLELGRALVGLPSEASTDRIRSVADVLKPYVDTSPLEPPGKRDGVYQIGLQNVVP